METATLRIIRRSGGQEDVTYRNLQIDGFNPDIIIGESHIAQLILQGNVYDEGVQVQPMNMQADDMYTADILCVSGGDFYARSVGSYGGAIRAKLTGLEYEYIGTYQDWFRIIDDKPSSIEFRFDSSDIFSCRIYLDTETNRILLVFLAMQKVV